MKNLIEWEETLAICEKYKLSTVKYLYRPDILYFISEPTDCFNDDSEFGYEIEKDKLDELKRDFEAGNIERIKNEIITLNIS